jgi:hypothetical protein
MQGVPGGERSIKFKSPQHTLEPSGETWSGMAVVNLILRRTAPLACLFLGACSSLLFEPLDLAAISELARQRALAEPELDAESSAIVKTTIPKVGYYRMAGDYCQYFFDWEITGKRTVSVFGEGDIKTLEHAQVRVNGTK